MTPPTSPRISVIVPIYAVERYVGRCLESLIAQTLRDIEVVAVDDGSPDSSGRIADEYAHLDSRVKVIHQANGGLAPARNTGIENACGQYIAFVDSDDWVHPDMLENLYRAAMSVDADIAVGGCEIWSSGKPVEIQVHPNAGRLLDTSAAIQSYRKLLYGRLPYDRTAEPYPVGVTLSIYRRSLIEGLSLRFESVLSEDVFFNLDALGAAQKVVHIHNCGYCYRKDCQDSITRSFSSRTVERYVEFFNSLAFRAAAESEAFECQMRARRKMVDYCRSLVFMVEKTDLTTKEKVEGIRTLVSTEEFLRYCAMYPPEALPRFQSLFHRLLISNKLRATLLMARMRMIARAER